MCRRGVLGFLASLTAAIGSGGIAAELARAESHRTPLFIAGTWTGRRPVDIYISGDGGNIITRIHWRAWKHSYAYGVGTSNIQGCVPDCASGSETPVRTTITLSHPASGHWTKLVEIRRGHALTAHYGGASWPLGAR
jgi:hypothetical protein